MSTAFRIILEGTQEVPANDSKASGLGTFIFDSDTTTASYSVRIEGVDFGETPPVGGEPQTPQGDDDVVSMHFHAGLRGAIGPVVFGQIAPFQDNDDLQIVLNADGSWTVSGIWELSDPSTRPITDFDFESVAIGADGPLYFNVHTDEFPMGEIRGQLVAIADDNDNVVDGTPGHDLLPGLDGNDAILGFAGDDTLLGGDGRDALDGGKGADIVDGGAGDDLLTGAAGPDLFVFHAGFGLDVITDLHSQDQIQFDDDLFPDAEAVLAESVQVGDNVVITLDENNTVTLLGVKLSSLQADDFAILVTG